VLSAALVYVGLGAEDAQPWRLVVARALDALTAHPDPFIGSAVRYFAELSAVLVAAVALWVRRPEGVGASLAFALLARVSGDVPVCALMLMLAALSAVAASLTPPPSSRPPRQSPDDGAPLEVMPATR
jgi:hypothetical protein